jgi:hypothetical protein
VKTATDQPAEGQVIETTTRKRIVSVDSSPESRSTPEFWAYLQSLDTKPGEWDRHIVYLYRTDPGEPGGHGTPGGKYVRVMQFPDRTIVPLSDQEEVELNMATNWGGRVYRFIVKKQHQRITEGRVYIDAPPKPMILEGANSASGTSGATVSPTNSSDVSQIAGKAIDVVAGQDILGIKVAVDTLAAMGQLQAHTMNLIRTTNANPTPAPPSEADQMFKMMQLKMMEKMMERMDAPAPAPTGIPGLNGDVMGRFFSTVIERGLNPPVATNGNSVSGVAAVASVLPQVLSYGAQIAQEIRMKAEAERDTVIAARSPQSPHVQPPAPRPQVLPPSSSVPAPAPNPNGADGMQGPGTEFVESRIIQILQQPTSAEEAADAVLMFLHTIDGPDQPAGAGSVAQLVKLGESGLVQLFNFRPKLKPATANMPRLLEFIRAFLQLYAEDQKADQAPPTPPPMPN